MLFRGLCAALVIAFASSSCATMRGDSTVCPEYRNLSCVTGAECTMDTSRQCRVCQCSSPLTPDEQQGGPRPVQNLPGVGDPH